MSPQIGVFKKLLSISPIFSKYKKILKSAIFDNTSSGGDKRRFYQKKSYWQDTCGKKCYILFLSTFVSTCCFDLLTKEYISNYNEISLKKDKK